MTDLASMSDDELERLAGGGGLEHLSDEELAKIAGPEPKQPYSAWDALAPWDALLHTATGALGGVAGGLRGITSGGDQEAMKESSDFLTYQPRTRLGQEMTDISEKVLGLPARAADAVAGPVAEKGYPLTATALNVGIQALPALAGSKGTAALRESAAGSAAKNAVKNATMRRAVDADYRIPPSELAQSAPAKAVLGTLEGFGGKAALQQDASVLNNQVILKGLRKDLGIGGEGQISEAELDHIKDPHFKVYEEAGNVSPEARAAKEQWRKENYEAKRQNAYFRASKNPAAEDAAKAAQSEAARQMSIIEQEALKAGKPDLVSRLRASRIALGKIGTVEQALNEATGEASASSLKKAQDRGVPLTGNMAQAAEVSRAFQNKLTQPNVIQPGVSKLDAAAAAAAAALKGPKWLAVSGMPYLTRKLLLSKALQKTVRPAENIEPIAAQEQLRRAAVIAALQKQKEQ